MGNLIKDFWTHENYYGITEVVGGSLEYRKSENKYETRIEKALAYMLRPKIRMLSHMSVQTYNQYLNKDGRLLRDDNEKSYYPFVIELETKVKPDSIPEIEFKRQYREMLMEAYMLVTYLIFVVGIEEKDILIMVNNARSVYILINPVSYELIPSNKNHLIYKEMFKLLCEELSLSYADIQIYKHNGLMKTPNTYYNGGYFVPISYEELKLLRDNAGLKKELTRNKRSMDYEVPGKYSMGMAALYQKAKDNINDCKVRNIKENKVSNFEVKERNCVKYILENVIEDGRKNFALVSVVYNLKEQGHLKEITNEAIIKIANDWGYENERRMEAKVKSIYKSNKNFSCDKARACLGLDELCKTCSCNLKNREKVYFRFKVHKTIIEDLWDSEASLRHYITYLILCRKDLFNKWFSLETQGINIRTLRELCKLSGQLMFKQDGGSVFIYNKLQDSDVRFYLIPNSFIDNETYKMLDCQLKHYLKLLFTGYKTGKDGNYIQTNVKIDKIKGILNYRSMDGIYKLLQKLKRLGLAVFKNGKLYALYYRSYRVIDIKSRASKNEFIEDTKAIGANQSFILESNYIKEPDTG